MNLTVDNKLMVSLLEVFSRHRLGNEVKLLKSLLENSDNYMALNLITIISYACPMCEAPHRFQLKLQLSLFSRKPTSYTPPP